MQGIDIGKVGEYAFATELLKRGYVPLWPSTESVPYDLAFWNGVKLIRVQVKASKQFPRVNLAVGTQVRGKRIAYTKAHADILVIWAMNVDRWYLIPIENVTKSIDISLNGTRCKWKSYADSWDLLKP